jgi:hypothetical protein
MYMCIYTYIKVCIHIYIYIYKYLYIYTSIYMYIYIFMYLYMYIYAYIYNHIGIRPDYKKEKNNGNISTNEPNNPTTARRVSIGLFGPTTARRMSSNPASARKVSMFEKIQIANTRETITNFFHENLHLSRGSGSLGSSQIHAVDGQIEIVVENQYRQNECIGDDIEAYQSVREP